MNSSINFVVYCFVGRRFRNTLISFFTKPSSNPKHTGITQDGITQAKIQSLGGLSSDLYPNNSRRTSCLNSPNPFLTLPAQIIEDSNTKTEERRISKVIAGNSLMVNTDELASLSSSDTTTQRHKNKATFI